MGSHHQAFLARCLSIDIEVDPGSANLFGLAAVRIEGPAILKRMKGVRAQDLDALHQALANASHPLGHNILGHDLPICAP